MTHYSSMFSGGQLSMWCGKSCGKNSHHTSGGGPGGVLAANLDFPRRLQGAIPLLVLEPLPRGVRVEERLLLAEDLVFPGVVRAPFVGRDHRGRGGRRLDEKVQPQRQDVALHVEVV